MMTVHRRVKSFWLLLLLALWSGPQVMYAERITFESDTIGNKPNGFQSLESDIVQFSASGVFGALFFAQNFGAMEVLGTRGLAVFGTPNSGLVMSFSVPVASVSLFFGNDPFDGTVAGDMAILRVFTGDLLVGQTAVLLNRNDIMDQSISFTGAPFDLATFQYTADRFLSETVDDISFEPVPEPATVLLLGTSLPLLAALARRRRRANGADQTV
jgi:hypothetical protein